MGITGWVTLTIAQAGNDDQRERWVEPVLRGEVMWCQLFSEPGAGSDAAAVRTAAKKVDGGWRITGQKVWTSLAHSVPVGTGDGAHRSGRAQARRGVTMMAIDMKAARRDGQSAARHHRCTPTSTRSSSMTSSCRTPMWSATSTRAGWSRGPRSATSASRSAAVRRRRPASRRRSGQAARQRSRRRRGAARTPGGRGDRGGAHAAAAQPAHGPAAPSPAQSRARRATSPSCWWPNQASTSPNWVWTLAGTAAVVGANQKLIRSLPGQPGDDDRGRHVGDHPQHHRRAHPRPAP